MENKKQNPKNKNQKSCNPPQNGKSNIQDFTNSNPKSKQPSNPNVQKFEILKLNKKKAENPPDIKKQKSQLKSPQAQKIKNKNQKFQRSQIIPNSRGTIVWSILWLDFSRVPRFHFSGAAPHPNLNVGRHLWSAASFLCACKTSLKLGEAGCAPRVANLLPMKMWVTLGEAGAMKGLQYFRPRGWERA